MDGTQRNKGQMRKLTIVCVCFIASGIGAALIPVRWTPGTQTPTEVPEETQSIQYMYTASLPERILQIQDVQERKQCLIEILLPLVLRANETILKQRLMVDDIKGRLPYLSREDEEILNSLARLYLVPQGPPEVMVEELLMRVDVLPVSLVLAQAAIESGWGTSRFSIKGNNIFGMRTFSGYGMVPSQRPEGERFAVSVFDDLQSCIDYYLWNINTNPKYEELRYIRSRSSGPYNSYALVHGLKNYSEQGSEYVRKVENLISYNALKEYDEYRLQ